MHDNMMALLSQTIGHRPLRMLVPSRVAVIAGQLISDFDDREHAPHFNVAEGTLSHHHRQRVVWPTHVLDVLGVLGHSGFTHGHVAGNELPDFFFQL